MKVIDFLEFKRVVESRIEYHKNHGRKEMHEELKQMLTWLEEGKVFEVDDK